MRLAGAGLMLWLLLATSASASTLAFDDGRYTLTGTNTPEALSVAYEGGINPGVVFADATGTLTADATVPADCMPMSAQMVRCTTLPERVAIAGKGAKDTVGWTAGADSSAWPAEYPLELTGGLGKDTLRGGASDDELSDLEGENVLRPGLGADVVAATGTLDFSQDDRTEGVTITAKGGDSPTGGDLGDKLAGFSGDWILTEFDDVFSLGAELHVDALGGDDFVDLNREFPFGSADCGEGDDLFEGGVQDGVFEDSFENCEQTGLAPGEPTAGIIDPDVEETERFLRLNGKRISAAVGLLCGAGGTKPCKFTMEVRKYGSTKVTLDPGERRTQIVHKLTPAELAAVQRDDPGSPKVDVRLTKKGKWINGEPFAPVTDAYDRILH